MTRIYKGVGSDAPSATSSSSSSSRKSLLAPTRKMKILSHRRLAARVSFASFVTEIRLLYYIGSLENAKLSENYFFANCEEMLFVETYARKGIVHLREIFTPGTLEVPKTPTALKELESIHKVLELYVWLSFRLDEWFPDHELTSSQKNICSFLQAEPYTNEIYEETTPSGMFARALFFFQVQVIVSSLSCLECFEFDGQSRPTRPQQKPSPRTATSSKPRKLERIIFLESVAVDRPLMLLMFDDDTMRQNVLASGKLDEWLENDGKEDEKARIAVSAVKGGDCENSSEETVVPNSILLTTMNTLEVDKMWEDNKVVDWRVMETASWMIDENIEMVQRDEEVRDSDVSAECGLRDDLPVRATKDADVISPICNGPSNRVNLTEVIEYKGQQRKGDGNDSLVLKMRGMKRVLKKWNRNSFGNVETQYQEIVGEIEALDVRLNSEELGSEDLQCKRDLHS
ncbi:hypothetical protein V6N12_058083 [Hibiscus sabdariffa]|uniref:ATP-dependent RNA helicase SUV3 C-terminal domain-containing protein n=1 Tax=Hibiscus sabdariffa TaxID=183260 RepID=A0ABR2BP37_9ROSI